MKIGRTKSDNDQKHPNNVDTSVDKIPIVLKQMHQQWRKQQKQYIAELKSNIISRY